MKHYSWLFSIKLIVQFILLFHKVRWHFATVIITKTKNEFDKIINFGIC